MKCKYCGESIYWWTGQYLHIYDDKLSCSDGHTIATPIPNLEKRKPVKKFEYSVITNQYKSVEDDAMILNFAGQQGWELVSVNTEGKFSWFYFKREIIDKDLSGN